MVYLDLAELDRVFEGCRLWSTRKPALAWFRRADYLGDANMPLDQAVRDLVESRTGSRPDGPIRMLTNLRYFAYCFNPVTFYYCLDSAGSKLETLVAEINNTPWDERFSYVLSKDQLTRQGKINRYEFDKIFHVSPFLPMDMNYDWRFSEPDTRLFVHMNVLKQGTKLFDATLNLRRLEISPWRLNKTLLLYPFMTLKAIAGIYYEAALLKLKNIPFYDHP